MAEKIINFKKFMSGEWEEPSALEKAKGHFKRNGRVYIRIVGTTAILVLTGADFGHAYTDGWIDRQGRELFDDLKDIAKWIIIIKGGWEIVKATLDRDFEGAKKNFIHYLLAYIAILALPNVMDYIDGHAEPANGGVKR